MDFNLIWCFKKLVGEDVTEINKYTILYDEWVILLKCINFFIGGEMIRFPGDIVNSINKLIRENQEKWIRAMVMLDRPKPKKKDWKI